MMGEGHVSCKFTGKVLSLCVTQALTEKQQEKVQDNEDNWVRRIEGVKRADLIRQEWKN